MDSRGDLDLRALLGRERELAALVGSLEQARAGRGSLCLLAGEPGIGKTRLADELSQRASTLGVPVLWGRCWEAGGAPAYWPWIDVLAGLVRTLDADALARTLGDSAGLLAELLPELRERVRVPMTLPAIAQSADQLRFGLFRAVTVLIRAAASERALVIVLDDLHAADEASLQLLHFVVRELHALRVLVVVTYRDVEARAAEAVALALARVAREGATISVGRLADDDAQRLLLSRVGPLDGVVSDEIVRRTQGNPLFLEEMARLIVSEGVEALASAELPAGVRSVLSLRLSRVSAPTHRLLELAATIGDEVDVALLASATGQPASELARSLDEARRAGAIRLLGNDRFRFGHALVREVLERYVEPERRRQLHAEVARTLEAQSGELPHAELAHHWLSSGPGGLARAVQCALAATARALELFAFEPAVALLERCLLAVGDASEQRGLRAQLAIALGQTQIRRGRGKEGRAACRQAAALARALGDAPLLARAALAFGEDLTSALVDAELVALLEEALAALLAQDSALRVRVTARLGAALQPHPDLMYPISLARTAIASARRLGDPETLLGAIYTGMAAMMDIVDPRERIPLNLEAEALAEQLSDRERLLRTQIRLMFDHLELGDLVAVDARIAACERMAQEADARRYLWRVPLMHSMRAMMHGRFSDAEALCEEARTLGQAAADPQLERTWVLHREGLLRAWERHDDMLAFDGEARRMRAALYSGPHWQNGGSAFTFARLERTDDARRYVDLVPQADWPLVHNPPAFAHLGEPLAFVEQRVGQSSELCRHVYQLLLPAGDLFISWGFTKFIWEGSGQRVLGLLAARLGESTAMRAHFERAIAQHEALGTLPYLARTRYEYGRALLEHGEAHEQGTARELFARAGEDAQTLGMTGLVQLVERRLATLGPAPSKRPERRAEDGECAALLSIEADGELVRITHAGQTLTLRESVGLRYLMRLCTEPGRSIHVLELSSGVAGEGAEPETRGDAGELLDRKARDDYRRRARELQEEIDEAEQLGASERAERARQELAFLSAELSRAVGLGGRARRAGAAGERARSAVQRRIRSAIERIAESSPELGALLERTVKTGTYCVFLPADASQRKS